jgi:xanthine dehydrogenase molybdopterin-binding subunit B
MRKTLTVAVAALAIGLTGCATTKDKADTDKYPPEAKTNYVDACTSTSLKTHPGDKQQAHDSCKCAIDKLEASLPYNRKDQAINSFKETDQGIKKGQIKTAPPEIQAKFDQAEADCRK